MIYEIENASFTDEGAFWASFLPATLDDSLLLSERYQLLSDARMATEIPKIKISTPGKFADVARLESDFSLVCSDAFQQVWLKNGLSGLNFKRVKIVDKKLTLSQRIELEWNVGVVVEEQASTLDFDRSRGNSPTFGGFDHPVFSLEKLPGVDIFKDRVQPGLFCTQRLVDLIQQSNLTSALMFTPHECA